MSALNDPIKLKIFYNKALLEVTFKEIFETSVQHNSEIEWKSSSKTFQVSSKTFQVSLQIERFEQWWPLLQLHHLQGLISDAKIDLGLDRV